MRIKLIFPWVLLNLIVVWPLFADGEGALIRQDSYHPGSIGFTGQALPPEAPFAENNERVLRFFPPLNGKDTPYLRLQSIGAGDLRLLLEEGEISFSLPDLLRETPLYVELPAGLRTQGIVLPFSPGPMESEVSPVTELPHGPVLKISWEDPDSLTYIPPSGDRDGRSFYSLKIAAKDTVRFDGVEESLLYLKPSEKPQDIALYPGKDSASVWTLSPLRNVESFEYTRSALPAYPEPLLMGMADVLGRPQDTWRNSDFELYKWVRFPHILIWDFRNYDVQNRFFRRLAYFVEKKGYRGRLLTNQELAGKHGWNAHDYHPEDLANFFNLVKKQNFSLYDEEWLMRDIFLENRILLEEPDGTLVPGEGAVISITRESSPVLRERFLVHEASHGLYFTSREYRDFVRSVWEGLSEEDRAMWVFFLGWYGYDPQDEDLMINEFQAYLVQSPSDQAAGYFDLRLRNLIPSYPSQEKLLSRGTGERSLAFRSWAETIGRWIGEKWGLFPGDFFPLYKELR